MTVSTTDNRVTSLGNGVTKDFPVPFKFAQDSDLVVLDVIAGVSTTKALGTDYTVTGAGTPSGTVSFITAPSIGHTVIIYRDPEVTQELDLVEGDPLPSESVETGLDKIVMMVQRVKELVTRAFVLADSTTGVSLTAPTPVAGKYLRWNATANALENADVATAGLIGTPIALTDGGTGGTSAAAARTNLGLAPAAAGDILVGLGANLTGIQPIGTDGYALTPVSGASSKMAWVGPDPGLINGYIDATVAANALTFTLKTNAGGTPSTTQPVFVAFRNSTAATANIVIRKVTSATTLTIPAGEAMGTANGQIARIWIGLVDNAGTIRIAAINCRPMSSGIPTSITALKDDTLVSTSTVSGTTAGVLYSSAALAGVPFRVAGYIEISEAAAGTWATAPSKIQHWAPGMKLPGDVVQRVMSVTGAAATGTTVVPLDDTIPQKTEGDQYMTATVTLTSAANVWDIEAQAYVAHSAAAGQETMSLYQDSLADSFASVTVSQVGASQPFMMRLNTLQATLTAVATTYNIRIGNSQAGTTTFNGLGGVRKLGGLCNSYLRIEEIVA